MVFPLDQSGQNCSLADRSPGRPNGVLAERRGRGGSFTERLHQFTFLRDNSRTPIDERYILHYEVRLALKRLKPYLAAVVGGASPFEAQKGRCCAR
jgi:hypothetical protein